MMRSAKSGCPVMGQSTVNSGAVNRATYRVSGWGLGTRSRVAGSGAAGMRVGLPRCLSFPAIVTLAGGNVVAELDRPFNHVQFFERLIASSLNGDITIVEQPTKNRLLNLNAHNFVHVHFNSMTIDETGFVDDAPIGDRDFGGEAPPPVLDQQYGPDKKRCQDRNPPAELDGR